MIFAKNQEVYFLELTCKTTQVPAKSAGTCTKFKNTSKGCRNKTRPDMSIPGGLLFMWGVFPSFRFRVLVAASQKNPIWYFENGKSTFRGTKQKSASVAFLAIPRATRMSDMSSF
jgi:hypothetical protein